MFEVALAVVLKGGDWCATMSTSSMCRAYLFLQLTARLTESKPHAVPLLSRCRVPPGGKVCQETAWRCSDCAIFGGIGRWFSVLLCISSRAATATDSTVCLSKTHLRQGQCENVANRVTSDKMQDDPGDASGGGGAGADLSTPDKSSSVSTVGTLDSKFNVFRNTTESSGENGARFH